MKSKSGIKWGNVLVFGLIIFLLMFGKYKWQEFKLEHIWGIKNPSFFQVWDSMGNRGKKKKN